MAGIEWGGGKLTRSGFAAAQNHNEKEARLAHQHSNEDIDKTRTHLNWSYRGLSVSERLRALDKRLATIDTGRASSGKNERVVVQSLVGYVPPEVEAMGDVAVRQWVRGFIHAVEDMAGAENVIDADVHYDEQHAYIDPDTHEEVMSRIHVHVEVVPVVTEEVKRIKEKVMVKDEATGKEVPDRDAKGHIRYKTTRTERVQLETPKLSAKSFCTRARINQLNKAVDDMTQRDFGVRYMTGKGKKQRDRSIEQAKQASAQAAAEKAEQEQQRLAQLQADTEQQRATFQQLKADALQAEIEATVVQEAAVERERRAEIVVTNKREELIAQRQSVVAALSKREDAVKQREDAAAEERAKLERERQAAAEANAKRAAELDERETKMNAEVAAQVADARSAYLDACDEYDKLTQRMRRKGNLVRRAVGIALRWVARYYPKYVDPDFVDSLDVGMVADATILEMQQRPKTQAQQRVSQVDQSLLQPINTYSEPSDSDDVELLL